jgi:hypothetical protein
VGKGGRWQHIELSAGPAVVCAVWQGVTAAAARRKGIEVEVSSAGAQEGGVWQAGFGAQGLGPNCSVLQLVRACTAVATCDRASGWQHQQCQGGGPEQQDNMRSTARAAVVSDRGRAKLGAGRGNAGQQGSNLQQARLSKHQECCCGASPLRRILAYIQKNTGPGIARAPCWL